MTCVCKTGDTKSLSILFDEYIHQMSSVIDEYVSLISSAFENLADAAMDTANSLFDIYNDSSFVSMPTKKKLKHKQPVYRLNYIQPQIKKIKYLPYQRRVY